MREEVGHQTSKNECRCSSRESSETKALLAPQSCQQVPAKGWSGVVSLLSEALSFNEQVGASLYSSLIGTTT